MKDLLHLGVGLYKIQNIYKPNNSIRLEHKIEVTKNRTYKLSQVKFFSQNMHIFNRIPYLYMYKYISSNSLTIER